MGRWMELFKEPPPAVTFARTFAEHQAQYDRRAALVLAEMWPVGLMHAGLCLDEVGFPTRRYFPLLDLINLRSPAYENEQLWLTPAQLAPLLAEFRYLRQLCAGQASLPNLAVAQFYQEWSSSMTSTDFEPYLDQLERFLEQGVAIEGWVLLET